MIGSVTRRAALRLSGSVGFGAVLTSLGMMSPKTAPALVSGCEVTMPAEPFDPNISPFQMMARKTLKLEDIKKSRVYQGFDPSIQCLRSVSPAMKTRIQAVRDEATYTLLQRLREKAGWL